MKNILGWGLVIIGLIFIFGDIFVSYNYFTGKDKFPEIFKETTSISDNSAKINTTNGNGDVQQQLQTQVNESINKSIQNQISQIIPNGTVITMLNISTWSVFAFLVLSAGVKIVNLGRNFIFEKKKEEQE
ncbi:MAG: hypothetical protein PHR47_04150 [Candidatus Pacebacteria bacterium]|nr:hypothetical protein [Candidatus Paceibacterota bacterium]